NVYLTLSLLFIISIVLLGVSLGLASPSGLSEVKVKLERGSCPPFWFSFDGRCYKYVSSPLTWVDAELYCVAEQANLVSIHSMKEHKFVKSLIENFDHRQGLTWIGLSDTQKESGWMWSDGGKEHCCEINSGPDGNWNDYPCSETLPSVCASRIPCSINKSYWNSM
uniref:C-type lectin domain-containing protein n=1 Tax=Neogobius melanostomus TaxID=47308 RepID=A0A8C6SG21_9GOBI